jgi:hypothetical protein
MDGAGFRALPVPRGEPPSLAAAPATAEEYLQLVRALSRRVPDVMVDARAAAAAAAAAAEAAAAPAPAPALGAAQAAPAADAAAWAAAALETFARLRATLLHVAIALEDGALGSLPPRIAARAAPLREANAATWQRLCFGGAPAPAPAPAPADAFASSHVWTASGGNDDDEFGDEEGGDYDEGEGEGGEYEYGEGDGEGDDEGAVAYDAEGGGDEGEGAGGGGAEAGASSSDDGAAERAAATAAAAPIPPLLSAIASLDQLAVVRQLTRSVRLARAAFAATGALPPPASIAWLYALLAALQLPLLNTTAAVIRDLFLLTERARAALDAAPAPADVAARASVETLAVIAGTFFAQREARRQKV